MKIIRNSSEDEMLLEYLKSEINSKRFGERLKKTLNELNISKDILLNGNLENKYENEQRKIIMEKFRGYPTEDIFERFPKELKWFYVQFEEGDIDKIFYLNWEYWNEISNGTSKPTEASKNIYNGVEIYGVSNEPYFKGLKYLGILNLEKLDNKIEHRKLQTQYLYKQLKEVKELGIYDYKSKEESNLFSPLLWINGVNKGIKIAKALSERGIINSTGTFGLIPANNRESIKKYCSTLNMYDKIYAINSENLLNNIIAVTLMEDYDKEKLDEIVKNIKELLK